MCPLGRATGVASACSNLHDGLRAADGDHVRDPETASKGRHAVAQRRRILLLTVTLVLVGLSGISATAAQAAAPTNPCAVGTSGTDAKALGAASHTVVHRRLITVSGQRECRLSVGAVVLHVAINVGGFSGPHVRISEPRNLGPGPTLGTDTRSHNAYLLFHRGPTCILVESMQSPHPTARQLVALGHAIYATLPGPQRVPAPTW
jgi:hypothetical protein